MMSEWDCYKTSYAVWKAIMEAHKHELKVFSSFSSPNADYGGRQGIMQTSWGIAGSDFPIIEARTTWDIDSDKPHERLNEQHFYWICVGKEADV